MFAGTDYRSRLLLASLGMMLLAGCSSNPPAPPSLDASERRPLNRHLQARPESAKHMTQMRLPLTQAIEYYVPAGFQVFTEEGVDMTVLIRYDNTRPWTESLGLSLARAGIEMVADLNKKTMLLKALPTSVGQILDTYVPASFKVYVDAGVDIGRAVKFDPKQPWVEELGRSLSSVGIDLIANLDKKIILVRMPVLPDADKSKGPTIKPIKQLQQTK